jgi:hypothetical protein
VRGFTIEGGYGSAGIHSPAVQWSHGIDALGVTNLLIEDVTVRNVAGDCVYLGLGTTRTTGAIVRNITCAGTGRNGVSFVAANNSRVEGGSYSGIGFIAFDAEPNPGTGFGVDGALVDGATVGSYQSDVGMVVGDGPVSNVTFRNIHTTAAKGARFRALASGTQRRQNVMIANNTASNSYAGDAIVAQRVDGLTVTGNTLPNAGVMLRCQDVTELVFTGNTPSTQAGCPTQAPPPPPPPAPPPAPPPPPPPSSSAPNPAQAAATLLEFKAESPRGALWRECRDDNPTDMAAAESYWTTPTPTPPKVTASCVKTYLLAAEAYHYANGTHP